MSGDIVPVDERIKIVIRKIREAIGPHDSFDLQIFDREGRVKEVKIDAMLHYLISLRMASIYASVVRSGQKF